MHFMETPDFRQGIRIIADSLHKTDHISPCKVNDIIAEQIQRQRHTPASELPCEVVFGSSVIKLYLFTLFAYPQIFTHVGNPCWYR